MAAPSEAFVRQYKETVQLLAQQTKHKTAGTCIEDYDFTGEKKFYEQYASDEMVEITTRYADTPEQLPDHRRRMVTPRYYVSSTLVDKKDTLQQIIDPASIIMQAKIAAVNRRKDDTLITAFNATAYTGQNGTTSQAFSATNQIAATFGGGGAVGLTKAKELRARKLLADSDVDLEGLTAVIGPQQLEDLLNTTEVASSDYNTIKALVQGDLNTWVGFRHIVSTRLNTSGSNRLCYFYQKMAMVCAYQQDMEARIDERPDKNYARQVYLRIVLGATRLEEERIIEVSCAES